MSEPSTHAIERRPLADMDLAAVVGPYRSTTLRFHDGTSRLVHVTDVETPYPDGKLIVSRTDPSGVIVAANPAFVTMSGYAETELLGAPHHILRHPDMPAVAFAGLWDTVAQGGKWQGYVKNLRRDGGFYWVFATVIPNLRNGEVTGYTSVRRKPARARVVAAAAAYAALLAAQAPDLTRDVTPGMTAASA